MVFFLQVLVSTIRHKNVGFFFSRVHSKSASVKKLLLVNCRKVCDSNTNMAFTLIELNKLIAADA